MLDAVMSAAGGSRHAVSVHDAMMRPVTAGYVTDAGGTAYIESAASCGLTLIEPEMRSPVRATSYGVGELVADAVRRGCRNIVVGLGGSAVSDAGTGMLRALTDAFADGGTFDNALRSVLGQCRFTIACDVRNPLYGPEGAACGLARRTRPPVCRFFSPPLRVRPLVRAGCGCGRRTRICLHAVSRCYGARRSRPYARHGRLRRHAP